MKLGESTDKSKKRQLAQLGELLDFCKGEITGAQVIVEVDGRRLRVSTARFEPSLTHPRGRLVMTAVPDQWIGGDA